MTREDAEVRLKVYTEDAHKRLEELDAKTKKLHQDFARAFRDGDTKAIDKITKEINKTNREIQLMQTNASNVQSAMKRLDNATPRELKKTIAAINNELNSGRVKRGSAEWQQYIQMLKEAKAELKEINDELGEQEGVFSRMSGWVNKWGASIAATTAGLAGITMTARSAVKAYAEMQAEEANVRKYTGMTEQQVNALNKEFKKMDTRTAREELNKFAGEAGRLGKQKPEDVLGFVRAANQVNVALDELGDGATLTLSKLTNIFGDEQRYGTEQSLLKVGSVINELSQNCTASAPYLTDFAKRLAGVGNQAHMTIPEIMALGAVLDSQGQLVEMSATAVSQLITKMFKDPAKIAKAAGIEVKKFTDTLNKDTNEALLMLLDTLNKKGGLDALAPVFADMGADGARASQVLSALVGNVDTLRRQIVEANKAFDDGTSITKEYVVQNTTVEAELEKARKRFNEITVELGQRLEPVMKQAISSSRIMLEVIKTVVEFTIEHKKEITLAAGAIAGYTTALKLHNSWTVITATSTSILTAATTKLKAAWVATKNLLSPLTFAFQYLANGLNVTYSMQENLRRSIKATSFTGWLAVITLVGTAIAALVSHLKDAKRAYNDFREATKQANEAVAEESQTIETLKNVIHDNNAKLEERQRALIRLRSIVKDYHADLTLEGELIKDNTEALDKYIDTLQREALVEAVRGKMTKYQGEYLDKQMQLEEKRKELADLEGKSGVANSFRRLMLRKDITDLSLEAGLLKIDMDKLAGFAKMKTEDFLPKEQTVKLTPSEELLKSNDQYKADYAKMQKDFDARTKGQNINDPKVVEAQQDLWNTMILKLNDKYKNEIAALGQNKPVGDDSPRGLTDKELKAQERERKKQEAAAKKERDEKIKVLKAEKETELHLVDQKRAIGEINYYEESEAKLQIEKDFIAKCKALYEERGETELSEYKKLIADEEKLREKELEYFIKKEGTEAQIESTHRDNENQIVLDFYDPNSVVFQNQEAMHQALLAEDLRYLEEKKQLYSEGTKEYEAIVKQKDEAVYNDQLRRKKEYADALVKFQQIYDRQLDREIRQQEELAELDKLHNAGLISEENYQKALAEIKKKYRAEEFDEFRNMGNEFSDMVRDITESVTNLFENFSLENLTDALSAGLAVMTAAMQQFTSYVNAARDLELANLDKKYDAEVKAAGKNQRKITKIEEKIAAEEAKIKKKYNDKAMKMEIAQAIAQTAMAAINAYASASKVSWVLGPIAAAMATAAGMVQVATIKKQHEAQAAGYYSGGFTAKSPDNRKEVGVVHANEFVANHQAVNNPALSPVLRLIDTAQRSNTVGSLTAADVSRAIGQGVGTQTVPIGGDSSGAGVNAVNSGLEMIAGVTASNRQALDRLSRILEDGIQAKMVMDGPDGFDHQWNRYTQMKNRVKR